MTQYPSGILIRRLLKEHIIHYRRKIIFAIFCMVIVAASTAANAWLMQPALDSIFIDHDRNMLILIPLAVLAVSLLGAAANYGSTLSMRYVGQRLVADLQERLFTHLMRCDLGMFHDESSGRLISRFTNDINLMRNAFSSTLTSLAKDSLSLIFLLGVMLYQNMELALITLLIYPIAIYPIIRLGRSLRKISDKTQNELGDFTATLDEIFQGVRTVKSYNREEFETNRAKDIINSLFTLNYKAARRQAASAPITEILSGITIALVIWYGGMQVLDGELTTGAFFSFIAAFLMAYRPVRSLSNINLIIQEGLAAANRLFNVLDSKPKIIDKPNAPALKFKKGNIHFDNVTFSYEGGHGVKNVSLEVPAGKTAALVGLSGGGKSTLMNLLLRFYDVSDGDIRIDGQSLRDITMHSLRDAIAFVPQESMLFDDTIRTNIAYGRMDASEEEIIEAAKNAAADEFIRTLPDGYDTLIGAHGVRLSGGQRQRISIARAMLKNAPILLLDEATSSLDNKSENIIQEALVSLMKGRTTLVIAHRLSTIVNADIIYVVEAGKIVESGTHHSLMEAKGKYYQLYARSLAGTAS